MAVEFRMTEQKKGARSQARFAVDVAVLLLSTQYVSMERFPRSKMDQGFFYPFIKY